jgi:flagellar hook-basal body complex protein FliE
MIDFSIGRVAAAYAANGPAAATSAAPAGTAASAAPAESGFGAYLDGQVARAVDTVRHGEAVSLAAIAGKASAQEVVQSVIAAEMTIQTVVAIRDKMVQAYQEIMRMPI